jgi:hypothetical protein
MFTERSIGRMGPLEEGWAKFRLRRPLRRANIRAGSISGSITMTGKGVPVYDPTPMAYKAVRVWPSDGSRMLGMWTGTKWWSLQGEIRPVRWELEERKKKKTDKLRKLIPKQFA